jgi:hypothetical protein
MEIPSIMNPPIFDSLNDPRLTSAQLQKIIDEQHAGVTKQIGELLTQVKREDINPFQVVMFALVQHHLHITVLNTKLTARSTDLAYSTVQLSLRLEKLTKWLIGLTIALGLFAVPLAIDIILKWVK